MGRKTEKHFVHLNFAGTVVVMMKGGWRLRGAGWVEGNCCEANECELIKNVYSCVAMNSFSSLG